MNPQSNFGLQKDNHNIENSTQNHKNALKMIENNFL